MSEVANKEIMLKKMLDMKASAAAIQQKPTEESEEKKTTEISEDVYENLKKVRVERRRECRIEGERRINRNVEGLDTLFGMMDETRNRNEIDEISREFNQSKSKMVLINGLEKTLKTIKEAEEEVVNEVEYPQVRHYDKGLAKRPKVVFAKPKVVKAGGIKKLLTGLLIAVVISAFFGIRASSYYGSLVKSTNATGNFYETASTTVNKTTIQLTFGWMTQDTDFNLLPFYADKFMSTFLLALLITSAVVLLIYADSEQKRASRIGKEHGNARLGTKVDYKKYCKKFMR